MQKWPCREWRAGLQTRRRLRNGVPLSTADFCTASEAPAVAAWAVCRLPTIKSAHDPRPGELELTTEAQSTQRLSRDLSVSVPLW